MSMHQFAFIAALIFAATAHAGPPAGKGPGGPPPGPAANKEPSPEARKKMAELHEKMAVCLKGSNKPFRDCQKEMRESCEKLGELCQMPGGGRGRGAGRGGGRGRDADSEPTGD